MLFVQLDINLLLSDTCDLQYKVIIIKVHFTPAYFVYLVHFSALKLVKENNILFYTYLTI